MKHKTLINFGLLLPLVAFILTVTSCSSIKNVKYFTDIPDSGKISRLNQATFVEPTIQPDDILAINIQVTDIDGPKTLPLGNLQTTVLVSPTGSNIGNAGNITGVLVDRNGDVELPILGQVHVGGLTTEKARDLIRVKATSKLTNPTVNVRFANFKITVLGEVQKPGTYIIPNEKVNILDALGLAGDLTIYGKRENILLVRQNPDGSQERVRIDLTKSSTLTSPYFYLRQNDYLIVEPIKTKVVASDAIQSRNINILTAITASLISLIAIIISTRR